MSSVIPQGWLIYCGFPVYKICKMVNSDLLLEALKKNCPKNFCTHAHFQTHTLIRLNNSFHVKKKKKVKYLLKC